MIDERNDQVVNNICNTCVHWNQHPHRGEERQDYGYCTSKLANEKIRQTCEIETRYDFGCNYHEYNIDIENPDIGG